MLDRHLQTLRFPVLCNFFFFFGFLVKYIKQKEAFYLAPDFQFQWMEMLLFTKGGVRSCNAHDRLTWSEKEGRRRWVFPLALL